MRNFLSILFLLFLLLPAKLMSAGDTGRQPGLPALVAAATHTAF